jgi:hypothetical protein
MPPPLWLAYGWSSSSSFSSEFASKVMPPFALRNREMVERSGEPPTPLAV